MKRFILVWAALALLLGGIAPTAVQAGTITYDIYQGGTSGTLLAEYDVSSFITTSTTLTSFTPTVLPAGLSAPGTLYGFIPGGLTVAEIQYTDTAVPAGLINLFFSSAQLPTSLGTYQLDTSGSAIFTDQGTLGPTPDTLVIASQSAIPEPASLTLMSVGGVALLGYGWRRRGRTAE